MIAVGRVFPVAPIIGRGRSARLVGELVGVRLTQVRRLALVSGDKLLLDLLNVLGSANRHLAAIEKVMRPGRPWTLRTPGGRQSDTSGSLCREKLSAS